MKLASPDSVRDEGTKSYLLRLVKQLSSAFDDRPAQNTGRDELLLVSPNGSVYSVKVTDAGAIQTTLKFQA